MKNCTAGHELVLFSTDRCPVCATIDRLDKELLKADARITELECEIEWRRDTGDA